MLSFSLCYSESPTPLLSNGCEVFWFWGFPVFIGQWVYGYTDFLPFSQASHFCSCFSEHLSWGSLLPPESQSGRSLARLLTPQLCFSGKTLIKVAEAEKRLGAAERDFIHTASINFLTPLRNFLEGDWKTISVRGLGPRASW